MKVTLRKHNQGGKTSLYLDYYHKGKRKTEYLKLYLKPNPKNKDERDVNKKTLQLAETIRAQQQIEIQNGVYGFRDNEKLKASFTNYVQLLTDKRKDSTSNYGNWDSMLKHLKAYIPMDITFAEVEKVIQNIEANHIDITPNYNDWKNIGFAFADEFGESGRSLFHRVSQYYSGYNTKECDKQFDNCLKSKGQGVSLKTFFFLAKQAGVSIVTHSIDQYKTNNNNCKLSKTTPVQEHQEEEPIKEMMPTFPKSLYPELPQFLQQVVAVASSDEERDNYS
ncbi:PriCT-2 domain-containing protein [Flavobacteriaceae bacterium F08102]|nr:PriCT-2 domain-containing protein [Flavobacteriaceae bacterium F08102]